MVSTFMRPWLIQCLLLVLVFSGTSCSRHGQDNDSDRALRIQLSSEPVTLDFSLVEDGLGLRVTHALMSGLLRYDHDYKVVSSIASRFEILDGGKRYRFMLAPWKWSDGKPVTAYDFVYAAKRTLDPGLVSKMADWFFFIKGARDYKRGHLKDFSKVGIRAVSEHIIEYELNEAIGFFPHLMTLPLGYPQREDVVDKYGVAWPEHMVTTGPYRLKSWTHDRSIELERNPHYGGFAANAPERVEFRVIPEEATAVSLLEQGGLDVLFKVPTLELNRLSKKGYISSFPFFATYYLGFDQRQKPWSDLSARQAIAYAIDRRAIVDALGGVEIPATSWIARGVPGANENIGLSLDRRRAQALAKHAFGKNNEFVIGTDSSSRNQIVLEQIQSELKKALGLRIKIQPREWKTYVRELSTKPTPFFRFAWLSPFVDPYASLMVFRSDSAHNYTGWKNAEYDKLLDRIAKLDDNNRERQELIDRAQRLLVEKNTVVVPIYHYTQTVAVSPRIQGFWVNGTGLIDLMAIRFK